MSTCILTIYDQPDGQVKMTKRIISAQGVDESTAEMLLHDILLFCYAEPEEQMLLERFGRKRQRPAFKLIKSSVKD